MARATKPRRLRTAGRSWLWRVQREPDVYPGYVVVRLWREAGGGGAARLDVRVRFDDPWLNYGPIITAPPERVAEVFALRPVTPKMVALMVEQALARGWEADARGTTTAATWNDGTLELARR